MITYTYWRYGQKCTMERDGTVLDVLQEAFNDIEDNTAYPVSICVDGVEVYSEEQIREERDARYERRDTGIVEGSAIIVDEQRALGENA